MLQSASPNALAAEARAALAGGRAKEAAELFARIVADHPRDLSSWLGLISAHRVAGDHASALSVCDQVLALDPRNFAVLLTKGSLLEALGRTREAITPYSAALVQAPPEAQLDPATRKALARARDLNQRYVAELDDFIRGRVDDALSQASSSEAKRASAFIDLTLRKRQRYQQEPVEFFYPGLPAIEFYDRALFPWLEELEAATPRMRAELEHVLEQDQDKLEPYINYDDHLPMNQWRELNKSSRWSALHFALYGRTYEENRARCPQTVAAIDKLPQPSIQNRCPASLFSVLAPRTHIPPHTGVANIRLLVHLPLILPPDCRFRVGGETRPWRMGEAWVFDDTIQHEAWNDSDQVRTILICDIWSPLISESERAVICGVMTAMDAFGAESAAWNV